MFVISAKHYWWVWTLGTNLILVPKVSLPVANDSAAVFNTPPTLSAWGQQRYALNYPRAGLALIDQYLQLELAPFARRDALLHGVDYYQDHYLERRSFGDAIKRRTLGQWCSDFLYDFFEVNRQFFTIDTMKVLTGVVPLYIITRQIDHNLHRCFYDAQRHLNIRLCPEGASHAISRGVPYLIAGMALLPFAGHDPDWHLTADVYFKGVISIWLLKDLIKHTIKTEACRRPWNQHFSAKERSFGGFPSGHMAEMFYTTTLFGWRHGAKIGLPLSIYTAALFITSLSSNRHYASQLVAGAGLGLAYTLATLKVINKRESIGGWSVDCDFGQQGTGIKVSYEF